MASSGRYRSNVFNFLSRQSMRLQDQVSQTWRQAKLAAVWSAQILLYPLYVSFQATRLVGKRLSQTARRILPKLRAVTQTVQPVEESEFLFADTPIQRSLQTLSDLALLLPADRLALQLDPQDPNAPGVWVVVGGSAIASSFSRSQSVSQEISLQQTVKLTVRLIVADSTKLEGSGKLETSERSGAIQIQGIASLLKSQRLVLVNAQNQLLDVLSLEQQMFLQHRMAGDVASYCRQQRVFAENQWGDRFLPLPKDRTLALPPIRAFWQLMIWMQTSSVAVATNLFRESKLLSLPLPTPVSAPNNPASISALRSAETSWKTGDELLKNLSQWFHDRLQDFSPASRFSDAKAPSSAIVEVSSPELQLEHPPQMPSGFSLPSGSQGTQRSSAFQGRIRDRLSRAAGSNSLPMKTSSPEISSKSGQTQIVSAAEKKDESAMLAKPSWIEAEVRLVTYEKHPLEQLFDWLDRGMLWVEDLVVDIWKWLRDRWSA